MGTRWQRSRHFRHESVTLSQLLMVSLRDHPHHRARGIVGMTPRCGLGDAMPSRRSPILGAKLHPLGVATGGNGLPEGKQFICPSRGTYFDPISCALMTTRNRHRARGSASTSARERSSGARDPPPRAWLRAGRCAASRAAGRPLAIGANTHAPPAVQRESATQADGSRCRG